MDSVRSSYYKVTDVTFSTEEYKEAKDSDKVYYYIYFNDDPNWKMLATYYLNEHTYVFTEPAVEEPETEAAPSQAPVSQTSSNAPAANNASPASTPTIVASLDIMAVSSNFLDFTGGSESKFYDKIFNYIVEEKGQKGKLVGTMESYKIDPENQTAAIWVTLNTGVTVRATYKKEKNTYSFSGL